MNNKPEDEGIFEEINDKMKEIGSSNAYREAKETGSFIWDIAKTLFFVIAIAFLIRFYLVQPFYVEGKSMEPNYKDGEYLLIDEISYKFRLPERGEVIVFKPPTAERVYDNYIKRIIGKPGERVFLNSGSVYIQKNENATLEKIDEPYLTPGTPTQGDSIPKPETDENGKSQIPPLSDNAYAVLGDNRTNSSDSRVFGPVNKKNITGRAWFYIKIKPWRSLNIFGKNITIPWIAEMGRLKKPDYSLDKLSLSFPNLDKNWDSEKLVLFS